MSIEGRPCRLPDSTGQAPIFAQKPINLPLPQAENTQHPACSPAFSVAHRLLR
jgi:hypothetical protein